MASTKKTVAKKTVAKKTKTTRKSTPRAKSAAAGPKKPTKAAGKDPAKTVVKIDRRRTKDQRATSDRRKKSQPVETELRKIERRAKVNRRRQIDPTTCERDYSAEEVEFMNALEEYKRTSGRMFPTCSEVLEVIKNLGYLKPIAEAPAEPMPSEFADGEPQFATAQDATVSMVHQSLIF